MSASLELQDVVVARLKAHAAVTAIVAGRVYDNVPAGATFPYISLGPSSIIPEDADLLVMRSEVLQVDCWSRREGRRAEIKALVDAVKTALHGYAANPATAALVSLDVLLVQIMDDPDGVTRHGIVQVQALMEEN